MWKTKWKLKNPKETSYGLIHPIVKPWKQTLAKIFCLTNKNFPPQHKCHKIFQRNTLKISYSCMPNLQNLINSHNQNILKNQPQSTPKTCNCLKKENCPMNGLYLTESLLYYNTITCNNANYIKLHKGIFKTTFKNCYATDKKSFNFLTYKNNTKLSIQYWAFKTKQLNPEL